MRPVPQGVEKAENNCCQPLHRETPREASPSEDAKVGNLNIRTYPAFYTAHDNQRNNHDKTNWK